MIRHKKRQCATLALFAVLSASALGQSSNPVAGDLPGLSLVDQRFLTQSVRRIVDSELAGKPLYVPSYIPPAVATASGQVVVTLREYGKVRGIGVSKFGPLPESTREAAVLALESSGMKSEGAKGLPAAMRIDMQVLGSPVVYAGNVAWTAPGALDGFVDPGIEGVNLFFDGQDRWFTPAGMIARNVTFKQALDLIEQELSLDPAKVHEGRLSKFATMHWWEYDEEGHVVNLVRGMTRVEPSAVTASGLDAAIRELGAYMIHRQLKSGRFAYEYLPNADMYPDVDSELAQSGATWAMGEYASRIGGDAGRDCAERAIAERLTHLAALPNVVNAACCVAPDESNNLGITAQLCLALVAAPDPPRRADVRRKLVNAILWLQLPSGRFVTIFPPEHVEDTQDVAPGQALLALARCQAIEPSSRITRAFDAALPYYRDYYRQNGSPAMMPWHIQAFAQMAILAKRADYTAFAFEMADALCAHQLNEANSKSPELWGAIVGPGMAPSDATTAFVAALAEAAALARNEHDAERAKRYEDACRLGARFVMQLQIRPEECYYMRSPIEAIGGIRDKPETTRIRIDSCQHALLALMKTRQLLFDDHP